MLAGFDSCFFVLCNGISSGNSHMVDAIRMQMEVQRRLHEQLEVGLIIL